MECLPRNNQALRNKKKLKQAKKPKKNKKDIEFISAIKDKTADELLLMVDECDDDLENKIEKGKLFDYAAIKFPEDVRILDAYSEHLISEGEFAKASTLIKKSIELKPEENGHKYFNAAELLSGEEAVTMYMKGIEIISRTDVPSEESKDENSRSPNSIIASALSSIAELYMTPPLCDKEDAEESCEKFLLKALEHDEANIDALQCLANLRILRAKDTEAIQLLEKVVEVIKAKDASGDHSTMPSIDFRLQTARLLIELEKYKKAVYSLDTCIKEDDSIGEVWYLLAFCQYNLKKYNNALECANNALSGDDEDIKAATLELLEKLKEEIGLGDTSVGEDMDDDQVEIPEEPQSEEDISDDEDQDVEMQA